MEEVAALINKAILLNTEGRTKECATYYEDGIQKILNLARAESDGDKKKKMLQSANQYMEHLEHLKAQMKEATASGSASGQEIAKYQIPLNATGFCYERVFGKYLDNSVTDALIEETYLNDHYQLCNLVKFCELLVKKCIKLRYIKVTTTNKDNSQNRLEAFTNLKESLSERGIKFEYFFDNAMHGRQIILNKHSITICRGLHYFLPPLKYQLGMNDLHFRKCRQTTVTVTAR